MYKFFDYFFIIFHSILILFNLFGWAWKPLRFVNLITLLLTGSSWVFLGIFYGIGYCPLTDWHWKVLDHLGVSNLPDSYIQYLLLRIFHLKISAILADVATTIFYFFALGISLWLNLKTRINKVQQQLKSPHGDE